MKNKNIYIVMGSVAITLGLITFGFYASRCQGAECKAENIPQKTNQVVSKMNPELINRQVKNAEITLLDVREGSEWSEGYIEGALHIPLGNLNIETTKVLPKDKQIKIYCRSGRRAGEAEIKLKELGFDNVVNLGGIIEWQEKGGVLVK